MTGADAGAGIVRWGRSLFERGLTSGASGNISLRTAKDRTVVPACSLRHLFALVGVQSAQIQEKPDFCAGRARYFVYCTRR